MRAPAPRDAAITGAGCVTALGFGLAATWQAIQAGATGVRDLDDAPRDSGMASAALVEPPYLRVEVPREMEPQVKFLNGAGELAVEATAEAIAEAGLVGSGIAPEMRGLYLSQMDSVDWSCHEFHDAVRHASDDPTQPPTQEALNRASTRRVKPFFMLESLKNNAFSFLATMFELRGANTSIAGFSGPTWVGLDMGVRSLARGSVDAAVIVGAARPASAVARAEMQAMGFSQAPGEAAAALVLERHEEAQRRGAAIRAVVLGVGASTRPAVEGTWAPCSAALRDAARGALTAADVAPGELAAVIAPAVGEADVMEALDDLEAAAGTPTRAFKAETGHCALASDLLEAALVTEALRAAAGSTILLLMAGALGQVGAVVLHRP